jgi:DNA-binding GntR family transcriptional regulator
MAKIRAKQPQKVARRGAEDVLEILRDKIANHDLPPGSKLRESNLSEEFGVARARIREVFGALEERGLIERIPNRGAVVTRLDSDQVFNLFDVREVMEALSARLATEKQPPESWQDLVELFGPSTEAVLETGDLEEYIKRLAVLRQRMIEGAENPLLAGLLDGLYDRTRVLIRRLVILPGRAREGLAQHQQILAAMRRGDAPEAERLKRENIRGARECFRQYQKFIL